MKPERVCTLLIAIVLAAMLPPGALAQDKADVAPSASSMDTPSPVVQSAGLINDWLRNQSPIFKPFDLGGQFRVRYEAKEQMAIVGIPNSVDFRTGGTTTDNEYWLFREKVHLGYTPCDWFTAFVEGRDSAAQGDLRNPNPETDVFDLHQAYVTLGNAKEFPLTAKVGRQEIVYGDERLIGASDWNNVMRVFDAAKLHYEIEKLWVDLFGGRVVLPNDHHFNEPNNYDWFSGIYASTLLIPRQTTEMYFLSRNVSAGSTQQITTTTPTGGPSPRDIYTVGLRFKSLPGQFGGWDYEGEFAGQFGNFAYTATSPRLNQEAFAAHVAGGYTWTNAFGTPRLGLEYNYSSGDSSTNDNKHQTFDNLFPTNHKFYGYMDFFSWQNMHDVRVAASIKPLKKLTVTLDYHNFWLANTHDYFYQVSGLPRRTGGYGINPDAGSYVGSEVDLVGAYAITSYASVQAGYGHFFTGDYVKNTLESVGSSDANWVYVQLQVNF
jgi:hypothetical protein